MAVAKMLKVTVYGHNSVLDDVVDRLQQVGVVQIERQDLEEEGLSALPPNDQRQNVVDEQVADVQFLSDFLGRFREPDVAFGSFIGEKIHLTGDEYRALSFDETIPAIYRECVHISDRLGHIEREVTRLEEVIGQLQPWRDLRLQISQWRGTEHVALFTGTVPVASAADIRQSLRDACDELSIEEVGDDGYREAWVVMTPKDHLDDVRAALDLGDFLEARFDGLQDYPAEEIADAHDRIADLTAEREGLTDVAEELSALHYERIFALVQALLSDRDALEIRSRFNATDRAFLLTGWVCVRAKDELVAALGEAGSDVDVAFEEPGKEDDVPVELVNRRFIKPFEVLTDLYGRPTYGGIDPTPLMAFSYSLFFGYCVADVGYGLVLLLGVMFVKYRLDVAVGVKKFCDLIAIGSVAAMIVGVATRSYFALPVEALPPFLQYQPLILLPDEILTYLLLAIAIGVVHLLYGLSIGFYGYARDGNWVAIVTDVLPVPLLLAALTLFIVAPQTSALAWGLVAVAILLQGKVVSVRSATDAALVLPIGFIGVFNGFLGFMGDSLSYARLAALGLASFLVGDVINRLAGITMGAGIAGIFFAAMLFVVGQGINVLIGLIGAFVHPARLHLVEFFSKFYEAGGVPFAPFTVRTKSLILHPESGAGAKGGRK